MKEQYNRLENIGEIQNKVILFIHGIVGHPDQFQDFYPVIPDDYAKYVILLKGHGGSADDFGKAKMRDWQNQVDVALTELSQNFSEIYIVAHSMGTLFTLQRINNPKIKGAFLLAVPLKIKLKIKPLFAQIKRMIDYKKNPSGSFEPCYGIEPDLRFWKYLKWIPNFLALLKEIRKTGQILRNDFSVNKKIIIFQSANDEVVNLKTTQLLHNAGLQVNILNNSNHYQYSSSDLNRILHGFAELLN
ncbi:MAG: alpha/beta hydrolase [Saccharofermentanales bacterium]|jgi:carboxylesterase